MTLEINEITRLVSVSGVKKVIEPDLEQRRERRVRRDVTADPRVLLILAMHHRHRIPASQALEAPLQLPIAGIRNFLLDWNGVDIRRVQLNRDFHSGSSSVLDQGLDQFTAAVRALVFNDLVE